VEIPPTLRAGRRALEDLSGLTLLQDWTWNSAASRWYLEVALAGDFKSDGPIPPITRWCAVAENRYPKGRLEIHPSKSDGITTTLRHQMHNSKGDFERPWRSGNLCVTEPAARVLRDGLGIEPKTAEARLRWRFQRALEWLFDASAGLLGQSGEPYEVPDFPVSQWPLLVFNEGASTFLEWQNCASQFGTMQLKELPSNSRIKLVDRFASLPPQVIVESRWGATIANKEPSETGIWIRITHEPTVAYWHVADTWEELTPLLKEAGIDLDLVFSRTYAYLPNGKPFVIAIGFPIPELIGGPHSQIHWAFIQLPRVCAHRDRKWDRTTGGSLFWSRDKTLKLSGPVDWIRSENWSQAQLGMRGQFSPVLRDQRVFLIGAGALGSTIAEMLVRGGVSSWSILDGDLFKAGNLVRHTLNMADIGLGKASRLADRLNNLSPHTRAQGFDEAFAISNERIMTLATGHSLILDCTADDEVALELDRVTWPPDTSVVSLSLSYEATRLYIYTQRGGFAASTMLSGLAPYLEKDLEEHPPETFPREGIGCWHPIFPSRIELVLKCAARAVSFLSEHLESIDTTGCLMVLD
jgi:ThiF family